MSLPLSEQKTYNEFQSLLLAHDSVAKQEIKSANDQEPPDDFNIPNIPDGGVSVKLVHLEKTTEPLVSSGLRFVTLSCTEPSTS